MTPPCPRCGAKNPDGAARCYACGATLVAPQLAEVDEIPDVLMAQAEIAVANAPPTELTDAERAQRAGIATAATLGALILLGGGWWLIAILAFVFLPLGILISFAIPLGLIALWSWALEKKKR